MNSCGFNCEFVNVFAHSFYRRRVCVPVLGK